MNRNLLEAILFAMEAGTTEDRNKRIRAIREEYVNPKMDLEGYVLQFLKEIGVPTNLVGHNALTHAIQNIVRHPNMVKNVTKVLYVQVAKEVDTTPSRAERAMRHAIECAWDRCDLGVLDEFFGESVSCSKGKPTVSEFVSTAGYIVRDRMRKDGVKIEN